MSKASRLPHSAKFFSEDSLHNFNILKHLKSLIARRNISNTSKHVRKCNLFISDALDGCIVAAAVNVVVLRNIEDNFVPLGMPPNLCEKMDFESNAQNCTPGHSSRIFGRNSALAERFSFKQTKQNII